MSLGLNRGEIILVAFIFALVYLSGLLPKIAARLAGGAGSDGKDGRRPMESEGDVNDEVPHAQMRERAKASEE